MNRKLPKWAAKVPVLNYRPSAAAWSSVAVAGLLVVVAVLAWAADQDNPWAVNFDQFMTPTRAAWLLAAAVLAVAGTYGTVWVWMNDLPTGGATVSGRWSSVLRWLSHHGNDFRSLPCYLVLGTEHRADAQRIAGVENELSPAADGGERGADVDAAVIENSVLLFARRAGRFGGAGGVGDADVTGRRSLNQGPDGGGKELADASGWFGGGDGPEARRTYGGDGLEAGRSDADDRPEAYPTGGSVAVAERVRVDRVVQRTVATLTRAERLVEQAREVSIEVGQTTAVLDSRAVGRQTELIELCRRLRIDRFPVAPLNGVLVVADIAQTTATAARSLASDLDLMASHLGCQVPLTLTMLDRDPATAAGWTELARRRRTAGQSTDSLIGVRFDPERVPTRYAASAAADDAVESLLRAIDGVLTQPDCLVSPGNESLVRLAIAARRWRAGLGAMLSESIGRAANDESATIFAGLIIAGGGDGPVHAATRKPIWRLLADNQHCLRPTAAEIRRERWLARATVALIVTCVVVAGLLIVQIARWVSLPEFLR